MISRTGRRSCDSVRLTIQPDDDADDDPAGPDDDEVLHGRSQGEGAGRHDRDRRAVGDQRRCVVDQALALEDGHDPARDAEAPEDRRGRHGVRWRDDRAQGERDRGLDAGHEPLQDDTDDDRREQDEPDGEQEDRPRVRLEVADRREERRREQDRRQEQQEDDVRLELDRGAGPGRSSGPGRRRAAGSARRSGPGARGTTARWPARGRRTGARSDRSGGPPPRATSAGGRGGQPARPLATRRALGCQASKPGSSSGSRSSAGSKPKTAPRKASCASRVRRWAVSPRNP